MGRIRILPDNVANQIAAGEVVERPASVLKELIENSIDAGASDIRVEVESGGKRLIRVADDGCGMMRDDALLAFERHATSKLSDLKDLQSIATLGFRGEALPSIGSVSRLLLETRSREETTGTTVEIAGGKILRCEESARASGTVITVRDLFYNVPARRKFLRSEQTELAHIASLITHYSLAHPAKSFELRHGAAELLSVPPVKEMCERVYQVFGSRTLEDLIDLGYVERELAAAPEADGEAGEPRVFALRGFVSRPQLQKANRNSIYLFVNGRLIRDKLLLHAISAAYHNLMPPAAFPFALLFLDCDCEEVDVNVHPAKTEVRFRHASLVHDFVRDRIREVLMASRPASNYPYPVSPQPGAQLPYSEFTQSLENDAGATPAALSRIYTENSTATAEEDLPVFDLRRASGPAPRLEFPPEPIELTGARVSALRVPDTHGGFPIPETADGAPSLGELSDLRPLGQLQESFIIAAGRDGLWIIDQHVAHERILFEQVLKQRRSGGVEMQRLLLPLVIELTAAQQVQYSRIAEELNATGFETEVFGQRSVAVKAAPSGVAQSDVERIVYEVLEIAESSARGLSVDDVRRNIAASIACRSAIKIHTRLEARKMEWLLSALAATDYPMSCPHGRPIALRYPMRDILKSFHRI